MLKKLLTLSLVAIMSFVMAFACDLTISPVYAADEEITEEANEEFGISKFTVLKITENEGTQTATNQSTTTTMSVNTNVWLLVKVAVGENWKMDATTIKLNTATGGNKASDSYGYYVPITKDTWEDAADGTIASPLTKPSALTDKVVIRAANGTGSFSEVHKEVSFAASTCSSSYDGENLYFAIEFANAGVGASKWEKWNLTVDGAKIIPAVTEAATEEFDISKFTVLKITENEGTQTAASQSTSATMSVGNVWLLVKVAVGENWKMDATTVKLTTTTGGNKAIDSNGYYVPISKEAWLDAVDGTVASPLTKPSAVTAAKSVKIRAASGTGSFSEVSKTATFAAPTCSSSYDGENLYFAIEFENAGVGASKWEKWKLTANGEKLVPAVDDFSDAVIAYDNSTGAYKITTATTTAEAYLIIASFTGTTINDVKLVSIDATEGLSGTITPLEEGTIKIFLLDKATLAPAIGVTEQVMN